MTEVARSSSPTGRALLSHAYSGHARRCWPFRNKSEHVDRADLVTALRAEQRSFVWLVPGRNVCGAVTGAGVRA